MFFVCSYVNFMDGTSPACLLRGLNASDFAFILYLFLKAQLEPRPIDNEKYNSFLVLLVTLAMISILGFIVIILGPPLTGTIQIASGQLLHYNGSRTSAPVYSFGKEQMNIGQHIANFFAFLKETFKGFFDDDCMRMAAALSYYAVFSLPPLLFLLITILGYFFRSEDVRRNVSLNLVNVVGKENAGMFESLLTAANKVEPGIAGSVIGLTVLVVGASVLMNEIQSSLNKVWQVKPCEEKPGILNYLLKRLISLSMLLIIAALLVFSLAFNAALSAFGEKINVWLNSQVFFQVLRGIHFLMSFIMLTFLFAWTFKVLPNAAIRWKDVWIGAFVTAILFILGNYVVGIYLGHSNPASAYGAAASLGVILIWIYYASMIFLYGAEFTRTWSQRKHPREEC